MKRFLIYIAFENGSFLTFYRKSANECDNISELTPDFTGFDIKNIKTCDVSTGPSNRYYKRYIKDVQLMDRV